MLLLLLLVGEILVDHFNHRGKPLAQAEAVHMHLQILLDQEHQLVLEMFLLSVEMELDILFLELQLITQVVEVDMVTQLVLLVDKVVVEQEELQIQ